MATPQQITDGRKNDGQVMKDYEQRTNSVGFSYFEYEGPGGAQMCIGSEHTDPESQMKSAAVHEAMKMLANKGFSLPSITFLLTAAEGVPCIACMGNVGGEAQYTVFLGPKTGVHNPQIRKNEVPGGLGARGPRGVADQVYDSTWLWRATKTRHQATAVIIHEIGHILHERNAPGTFWDFKRAAQAAEVSARSANLAMSVSMYATSNPLEFVAETFAGQVFDKRYEAAVQTFYQEAGGPLPG